MYFYFHSLQIITEPWNFMHSTFPLYINYKNTTRTWEGTTTYYKTAFSNNMIRIIGIYYFTSKGIN